VAAVLAALQAQLRDWPDHPILSQLAAICARMLAFPATVPLKQALTGVELLLARAQLWEETADKHVSIQGPLTGGKGLAGPSGCCARLSRQVARPISAVPACLGCPHAALAGLRPRQGTPDIYT
jgi:hypothetical protein